MMKIMPSGGASSEKNIWLNAKAVKTVNDKLTAKQLRELVNFHKTDRANQPHMRPTGRIITDPKEMSRLGTRRMISEVVIRINRSSAKGDEQQDD